MNTTFSVAILAVSVVLFAVNSSTADETLTSGSTEECLSQGGLCVPEDQCPAGKLSEVSGLCGQSSATECCHSLPSSVNVCQELGGFCATRSQCALAPRDPRGECPEGRFCCIHIF